MRKKLHGFLTNISKREYFKHFINLKDFTEETIENFYDSLPIMTRQDAIQNMLGCVSDCLKEDLDSCDLNKILTDMNSISGNHDRVIVGKNRWKVEYTTGSTGHPFPIIKSDKTRFIESRYLLNKRREVFRAANSNNGLLFLHPNLELLKNMDIWKFNERDMMKVVEYCKTNTVKWLFATPLILKRYSQFIYDNECFDVFKDVQLAEYTSQPINDEDAIIHKCFGDSLISNYGCREFWNIAYECKNGHLHLNDNYLKVDLVDDTGKIIKEYDKEGYVVITSFANLDMPLLKYYLGDKCKIKKNNCSCGCQSDIIEFVPDNRDSYFINTNINASKIFRRVMRGVYFHDDFSDIKNVKVVQKEEYVLIVYVDKEKKDDKLFEEQFVSRIRSIYKDIDKYLIVFDYNYIFDNSEKRFKEIIFKAIN